MLATSPGRLFRFGRAAFPCPCEHICVRHTVVFKAAGYVVLGTCLLYGGDYSGIAPDIVVEIDRLHNFKASNTTTRHRLAD